MQVQQRVGLKQGNDTRRVAAVRTGQPAPVRVHRLAQSLQRAARRSGMHIVNVAAPEKPANEKAVYTTIDKQSKKVGKPRVVVLGSGWGAVSFIKALPSNISEKYELIMVSPRNYFLYTPLLPAVATGTMEERSIVEPVRSMIVGKGEYYEALCKDIDPVKKELVCCFPADAGFAEACFKISYDILVVGVGSVNNTFGIKGVDQYCNFFKSIEDANSLRNRVSECFERAALPATPESERKRLLSFVVVGGGPTGVEVAAEMYDMVHDDLRKLYPNLIQDVQIRVVELMDHVLSTYDRAISIYTADQFKRAGIKLVLNSRVASVSDGIVKVVNKANESEDIPFGACVWATGVAMNPFIKELQTKLGPKQNHFRSILTDEFMRVKGSKGSIYAIGDAATIDQPKALERADELFKEADVDGDDKLTLKELRDVLIKASSEYSHLKEHAEFLEAKTGTKRWGGLVAKVVATPLSELSETSTVSRDQFKEILKSIDSGLRALPATAQVARQQGDFLADFFNRNQVTGDKDTTKVAEGQGEFKYFHKGSAAYVGGDNAVFDVPSLGPFTGFTAGLVWKSFETYSQFSFRNQCLVASDWIRTKLFGRDISRV
mmetsp:Transcript_9846/g.24576  ORF Transcript_9846/g.24576 Transcript_9846/m.24576 type:complete len:605 (-) Transcript_9846:893-2707(-)|eukprot:CAMPEP_0202869466 /NCGR_PEP_ID=MMETSP1391-20130828/12465_1 /ASSEMBLY_ACC=CAM_ASM_000867 /TAXON_ID=1034604 /ORGANISM="Chlamydomonas leiostraca, Strain SAG 11-49" /LENGTH=604 /DNA_ID=CAMNT_0049549785 /DNA_START=90 /DNA_END=1904 /DNA_ORIENTATION=+